MSSRSSCGVSVAHGIGQLPGPAIAADFAERALRAPLEKSAAREGSATVTAASPGRRSTRAYGMSRPLAVEKDLITSRTLARCRCQGCK